MNLLIIGPQGSGKGTQGRKLAREFDLEILEVGQILRDETELDTPLSREVKKLLANGNLLPSAMVNATVNDYLNSLGKTENLLFDAYPRHVEQWDFLKKWMEERGSRIDAAINLELDDVMCIERLEYRVMSRSTKQIFNYRSLPPADDWPKDDLVVREDDKPESVRFRLEQYRKITTPLLDIYEQEGILINVDGDGTIEEVFRLICDQLKERNLIN